MACARLAPLTPLAARPTRTRARRGSCTPRAATAAAGDPLLLRVARGEGTLALSILRRLWKPDALLLRSGRAAAGVAHAAGGALHGCVSRVRTHAAAQASRC